MDNTPLPLDLSTLPPPISTLPPHSPSSTNQKRPPARGSIARKTQSVINRHESISSSSDGLAENGDMDKKEVRRVLSEAPALPPPLPKTLPPTFKKSNTTVPPPSTIEPTPFMNKSVTTTNLSTRSISEDKSLNRNYSLPGSLPPPTFLPPPLNHNKSGLPALYTPAPVQQQREVQFSNRGSRGGNLKTRSPRPHSVMISPMGSPPVAQLPSPTRPAPLRDRMHTLSSIPPPPREFISPHLDAAAGEKRYVTIDEAIRHGVRGDGGGGQRSSPGSGQRSPNGVEGRGLSRCDSEGQLKKKISKKDKDKEKDTIPKHQKRKSILGKMLLDRREKPGNSSSSSEFVCSVPVSYSSISAEPVSPPREDKEPPVVLSKRRARPGHVYVGLYSYSDDDQFSLRANTYIEMVGRVEGTNWAVVQPCTEEDDMSCSSSHYQAPGFYPLRWLKYVGPTLEGGGEKEENEIEHIDVDDESPPPPLKTTFEIAKPLLDNTPFLRHVGLHDTVKTLKITPHTTTAEMKQQLTLSVCRSLASYVGELIKEECSICTIVEVNPDGTERVLDNEDFPFKYQFRAKQLGLVNQGWHFLFKRADPDTSYDAKRKNIVAEIHSTEVFYCAALLEMIEGFRKPLINMARRPGSTVKEDDMVKMFGNCETILRLHLDVYKPLNQRLHNWTPTSELGDIFLKIAPVMIIYTEYSTGYPTAVDLWHRYQNNPDFVKEHTALRKKMALDNLLIMPVQRLPRYNLLLRDLLKQTPPDHPDCSNLRQAIDVIQRLCDRIDECTEKAATMQHMMDRATKDTLLNSYFAAHRQLKLDFEALCNRGEVVPFDITGKLKADSVGSFEKFYIYCFNDLLVFGNESDGKKKQMTEVPLNLVWCLESKGSSNKFSIVVPYQKLVVKCDDKEQRDDYVSTILEAISQYFKNSPEEGTGDDLVRRGAWENYDGEWKKGLPHGRGKSTVTEGVYDGTWVFGKMTGNGKYSFANGDTYDGGWVSGVMEGRGVYRTHTGVVYNGQMSGCRFHGSGTLTTPLGDKYEGQFVDNAPSGKGTLTFNDGKDVYEGDFVDGLFQGHGKMQKKEGAFYNGEWRMGLRHGTGLQQSSDGSLYEGEWRSNLRHGKGRYIDSKGNTYNGLFEFDIMSGAGKMVFVDGSVFEGSFTGGYRHGKQGKMTWANGSTYIGGFKMSRFHGPGCLTYPGGDGKIVLEGQWENGCRDGRFTATTGGKTITLNFKAGSLVQQDAANMANVDLTFLDTDFRYPFPM